MSLIQLIRSKLEAHYVLDLPASGDSPDITWLLRKWRQDFPADFRGSKLHSRSYWNAF